MRNCRCNGIAQPGRGGMVRRNVHINSAMPPNRGIGISSSDTKLKFSDRLKAYLASNTEKITESPIQPTDDPYQFSDSEVNNVSKKFTENVKDCVKNSKVYVLNGGIGSERCVKSETGGPPEKTGGVSHGKTMSRLQAQIARNKVTVKHSRSSPDPKHDSLKDTKRSIIGKHSLIFIIMLSF